MWNGWQMTLLSMWFTSKAELLRGNDSKSGSKCFLVLVDLICSVTGDFCAAVCQVMKWDMDRYEVRGRVEKKTGRQAKPKFNPCRVKSILYLFFSSWYAANDPTLRLKLEAHFHGQLS